MSTIASFPNSITNDYNPYLDSPVVIAKNLQSTLPFISISTKKSCYTNPITPFFIEKASSVRKSPTLTVSGIIDQANTQLANSSVIGDMVLYIHKKAHQLKKDIKENSPEAHKKLYDQFRKDTVDYMRSCDDRFVNTVQKVYDTAQQGLKQLGLNTSKQEKAEEQLIETLETTWGNLYGGLYYDIYELEDSVKENRKANLYFDPLSFSRSKLNFQSSAIHYKAASLSIPSKIQDIIKEATAA